MAKQKRKSIPLVMIEWHDSAQPLPSWRWIKKLDYDVVLCQSVGWLVHDGDDVKALAPNVSSIENKDAQASGIMRIPARSVVKVTRLTGLPRR